MLVFSSGLLEGATIQPHICIFTEPYVLLCGLLTDADGKAIFHQVREKGRKENKTKIGSGISWKRCKTGSGLIEKQNQIKLLDLEMHKKACPLPVL